MLRLRRTQHTLDADMATRLPRRTLRRRGARRQKTITSLVRNLCATCADDEAALAFAVTLRQWPHAHGCAICGQRSEMILQVWLRKAGAAGTLVWSFSRAYCEAHGNDTYDRITQRLGANEPRTAARIPPQENLTAARARIKPKQP